MEALRLKAKEALGIMVTEASALCEAKMHKMVEGFETEVKGLTDDLEEMKAWRLKAEALGKELRDKSLEMEALHKKLGRKEEEKNSAIKDLQRRAKRKAEENKSLLEEAIRGAILSKPLRNKAVSIFTIFEKIGEAVDEIESSYSELIKVKKAYEIEAIIEGLRVVLRRSQSQCSALVKRRWYEADLISSVFETIRIALRDYHSSNSYFVTAWVKTDETRTAVDRIFERICMSVVTIQSTYGPIPNEYWEEKLEGRCAGNGYSDDDNCGPKSEEDVHVVYGDVEHYGELHEHHCDSENFGEQQLTYGPVSNEYWEEESEGGCAGDGYSDDDNCVPKSAEDMDAEYCGF